MEQNDYVFLTTFYEKEKLRQATILLNDKKIDFQLIDKSQRNNSIGNFKAPLSIFIEIDIMIPSDDIERADKILKELIE